LVVNLVPGGRLVAGVVQRGDVDRLYVADEVGHDLAAKVDAGEGAVVDLHAGQVHDVGLELQGGLARHILAHGDRPLRRPDAFDQVIELVHDVHAGELRTGRAE